MRGEEERHPPSFFIFITATSSRLECVFVSVCVCEKLIVTAVKLSAY